MKTNFQELLNRVETNLLVLPDFQRKFVWDEEKMESLYRSVLCEMPVGSYLTLKSHDKEFSCKKIGAKPKSCIIDLKSADSINYLIDGQQRITSLFAGFSTYFFRQFRNNTNDIASKDLIRLYFIKIPTIDNNNEEYDIFNVRQLMFNLSNRRNNQEFFKTDDLKELIDSESVDKIFELKTGEIPDLTSEQNLEKLEHYCESTKDLFYRIPLQLLSGETDEINNCLRNILNYIAAHYADTLDKLTAPQKKNKQENWKDNIKSYFNKCLSELDLNLIEVENSDKIRAIDIYSNLNQGGIALSVFDLVMAKVGAISKDNYYDRLLGLIQKRHEYPRELLSDKVKNWIGQSGCLYDNASLVAGVINKNNDIDKYYINVFLNVLSLYTNKIKGKTFDENYVKQDKILSLKAEEIDKNTDKVCEAIDRALFFFQTHCGVRKIADLNYKAQLTLVAYIFTTDKYWENINIHKFFEYWYWMTLFANLYPSSQDVSILKEVPRFEKYFENVSTSKTPLELLKGQHSSDVLSLKFYSDKETLTMIKASETEKYPSAKLSSYICQFYLAKGYDDFFDENVKINFLYSDTLEMHHIMTLGSDPDLKIGEKTNKIRGKKECVYNSPLNMMYITKKSNSMISDMKYSDYSNDKDVKKILPLVGCSFDISNANAIDMFLGSRYDSLYAEVIKTLNDLYSTLVKQEFVYE